MDEIYLLQRRNEQNLATMQRVEIARVEHWGSSEIKAIETRRRAEARRHGYDARWHQMGEAAGIDWLRVNQDHLKGIRDKLADPPAATKSDIVNVVDTEAAPSSSCR